MKTNVHLLKISIISFLLFSVNSLWAQNVVYQEDFNKGEATGWTPIFNSAEGNWSVQENTAVGGGLQYNNNNGAEMISSIHQTENFENFSLTATIYSVWGNKDGIIFNYQDENNFYLLEHWAGNAKLYLREKVNGIWETGEGIDAPGGYSWDADAIFQASDKYKNRIALDVASQWYQTGEFSDKIKLDNANGKTSVWFNDVLIFDKIETPLFTNGKIGFFTHWNPAFIDDIKVVSAGSVAGFNYQEDFNKGETTGWTPIFNSAEGNWSVQENTAVGGGLQYNNNNGAEMISSIYQTENFENFSLTATIYSVWGNKDGIIFNYQDENNFYLLEHWAGTAKMYLREKVNGIWETGEGTDAAGGYSWDADSIFQASDKYKNRIALDVASQWYQTGEFSDKIKLDNANGKTSVWFNDILIFDKVETPLFTNGKIGFFTHWNPAFIDDIKVVPAGSTGLKKIENIMKSLVIYPNPVNGDIFTIDTKDFGDRINIRVYNIKGQLVANDSVINSMNYVVNVNERRLNKGFYIVQVSSENRTSSVRLVVN